MQIMSTRAKEIDAYIKDNNDPSLGLIRVELAGKVETLQVHRIPIDKLTFNLRNGRFAAELKANEVELKRKLDSTKPEDAKVIQKLLLTQDEKATSALKTSLEKDGQLDPGIITFDGSVINANRRMAILTELFEKTREPRYQYLLVGRLPQNVNEKDLWRIEAGLQFAKDYKLGYGPVNELLKLQEGKNQGMSPEDISLALMGRYSSDQVLNKLDILKLIENYLIFVNKPDQYHLVHDEQIIEKFNSLQQVKSALGKKGLAPIQQTDILQFAFLMINKTRELFYKDIRKLGKIVENEDALKRLLENFNRKNPMGTSENIVVDSYKNAEEIIENAEERDRPERLIRRALTAIESINNSSPKLKNPDVMNLLLELEAKVHKLRGK